MSPERTYKDGVSCAGKESCQLPSVKGESSFWSAPNSMQMGVLSYVGSSFLSLDIARCLNTKVLPVQ